MFVNDRSHPNQLVAYKLHGGAKKIHLRAKRKFQGLEEGEVDNVGDCGNSDHNPISQLLSMPVGLPILKIGRRSVAYILRKLGSGD